MRAAQRARIGNRRGPPAFAPVIWLGSVIAIKGRLDVEGGRDSNGLKPRRLCPLKEI